MEKQSLAWKVAGAAGEGIMTTGLLLSKTFARHGWYIFDYTEYPSLIRGGHNTYQIHTAKNPVFAQKSKVDVLVALNKDGLTLHQSELSQTSAVIYDSEHDKIDATEFNLRGKLFNLPMRSLAKEAGTDEVMANNVALGASIYLLGLDLLIFNQVIADVFADKGEKIISLNQRAAQFGYNYFKDREKPIFAVDKQELNHLTMTGNEAIALGALAGGLQFYAAYPMTPSSSILHYLAKNAHITGTVVKHAEDEISVINMAIGASFAGVRSMVGTSGGGFCLMVEALGLAGICELPIVIFEGQRPGPALGLPTWSDQGDLKFVLSASHGEFPRFVLAPGDAKEGFELSRKAQILAETYQTPVILLSDKYLSESRFSLEIETETYSNSRFGIENQPKLDKTGFFPRYRADTPIGPRTIPGTIDGIYIANADDHDQYGLSAEESDVRTAQVNKRNKKMESMKMEIPKQYFEEDPQATLTFISFGSTKGAIKAAREMLSASGILTSHLNLSWLWPFPKDQVKTVLEKPENVVIVEGNSEGQLANLIAQETGFMAKYKLNRYDGRPFFAEEIVDFARSFVK